MTHRRRRPEASTDTPAGDGRLRSPTDTPAGDGRLRSPTGTPAGEDRLPSPTAGTAEASSLPPPRRTDRPEVVLRPPRCPSCQSTRRAPFRDGPIAEEWIPIELDGQVYNHQIWRNTQCLDCGQRYRVIEYRYEPPQV